MFFIVPQRWFYCERPHLTPAASGDVYLRWFGRHVDLVFTAENSTNSGAANLHNYEWNHKQSQWIHTLPRIPLHVYVLNVISADLKAWLRYTGNAETGSVCVRQDQGVYLIESVKRGSFLQEFRNTFLPVELVWFGHDCSSQTWNTHMMGNKPHWHPENTLTPQSLDCNATSQIFQFLCFWCICKE